MKMETKLLLKFPGKEKDLGGSRRMMTVLTRVEKPGCGDVGATAVGKRAAHVVKCECSFWW
jgi:hypothetical protein